MKVEQNTTLLYAAAALAVAVAAFLFFENRRQNAQIVELLQRAQTSGTADKKQADPYLAGPVKNRVLKGYPEVQACYKTYLAANPAKQTGKLRVDWQISTSGRTIAPEIVLSDFAAQQFESCVVTKIAEWRFPEPPVTKYVEHTFRFEDKAKREK
ncbi:AgmX/PglI C-terminal domain-containing protein [Turneriella parva]|uniref:TonB family protein n=1 Tax=Turneriella parva (strain ATCC BAA-1111 / DSM 21527 / NCTC 11395 / H) TaxID=869212 RepID=I4B4J9_TURPD|nr:AgmX/PglI C-terminal domain-containing protein [Turneriella parva]AFM12206.1 hypothetical protein Turpa_1558 [Turneriella parva DSM 21527]